MFEFGGKTSPSLKHITVPKVGILDFCRELGKSVNYMFKCLSVDFGNLVAQKCANPLLAL